MSTIFHRYCFNYALGCKLLVHLYSSFNERRLNVERKRDASCFLSIFVIDQAQDRISMINRCESFLSEPNSDCRIRVRVTKRRRVSSTVLFLNVSCHRPIRGKSLCILLTCSLFRFASCKQVRARTAWTFELFAAIIIQWLVGDWNFRRNRRRFRHANY